MNRLLPPTIVAWIIGVLPAAGQTVVFDTTALAIDYYHKLDGPGNAVAQRFTTSGSGSLTLSGLSINVGNVVGAPWNPLVTIQENTGSAPNGVIVGSLTSDSGAIPESGGGYFDFSSSITLQPNTTYWAVFDINWGNGIEQLYFDHDYAGLHSGGDGAWLQSADYTSSIGSNEVWYAGPGPLVMTLTTTAVPEPSTYTALAGAAMLGFAARRRRRVASSLSGLGRPNRL